MLLPKVKLKILPTFPAAINGGVGIETTKQNGQLTVDLAYKEFSTVSVVPVSLTNNVLTYDTATDSYVMVPTSLLGGGVSGIADAPVDGTSYVRNSANWIHFLKEYPVNILNYGAIPNDASKAAVNTTAFSSAFSASHAVLVPAGFTFYVQPISVPTTARRIVVDGDLVLGGAAVGAAIGLFEVQSNTTGVCIDGIGSITVDTAAYPLVSGIRIAATSNSTVRSLKISGCQYHIVLFNVSNILIENNTMTGYTARSISAAGSNSNVTVKNNDIGTGTGPIFDHAVSFENGPNNLIIEGNTTYRPNVWSFSLQGGAQNFKIINNTSLYSRRESHVVDGTQGIISGNIFVFDNTSVDLGSSFANLTNTIISDNIYNQPYSPPIYLGPGCQSNTIAGNTFISPTRRTVSGAVNNGAGLIRLTVSTAGWQTGDAPVLVNNVGGVPNANGSWTITVIDANHMDLQASTFAGAYTSGGYVGDQNWCGVGIYSNSSNNTICNNVLYNFNLGAEFFAKEFDVASANNKIFGNVGDLPNNCPVSVNSTSAVVEDAIGTVVAKLPVNIRNGSRIYTFDGLPGSNPITGSSSGTWAVRIGNVWRANP